MRRAVGLEQHRLAPVISAEDGDPAESSQRAVPQGGASGGSSLLPDPDF
jgi:hypothetical protein